jgi:HD superfamily phosphohydrolase
MMQRDMKMTNVAGSVTATGDFSRFIQLGVVLPAEPIVSSEVQSFQSTVIHSFDPKNLMICFPEKLVDEAVALFQARFQMHHRVYTHKAAKQVEFMITDALILANHAISIPGTVTPAHPNGLYKMSECIDDMSAFSKLNDSIIDVIMLSPELAERTASENNDLRKAKDIITRIRNRDLYVCAGQTTFVTGDAISDMSETQILDGIVSAQHESTQHMFEFDDDTDEDTNHSFKTPVSVNAHVEFTTADIIVEKMHIHYGMKNKNPIDRLRFFAKYNDKIGDQKEQLFGKKIPEEKYIALLPRQFEERSVRLFCRDAAKLQAARRAFEKWCTRLNAHSPFPSLSQCS